MLLLPPARRGKLWKSAFHFAYFTILCKWDYSFTHNDSLIVLFFNFFVFKDNSPHWGFPGGSDGSLPAMWETWVWSLGQEDPPEKEMTTHSSILAWRILRTEEPGGLQSMGLQRVRHNWSDLASRHTPILSSWGRSIMTMDIGVKSNWLIQFTSRLYIVTLLI